MLRTPPRRQLLVPAAAAAAAALYPAWLTWREQGDLAPFRFFAADAFYYLAVAERSQGRAFYTFDGRFATNGFHPLWQWLLGFVFGRTGAAPEMQVLLAFALGAVLVAIGAAWFAAAVARATGQPGLALLAAVPGFYSLLLPPVAPGYFAAWSFANGMESGVSIAAFGVLAWLLTDPGLQRPVVGIRRFALLGLVGSAMTLARLDDVFVFGPLLLLAWAASPSLRAAWPRALAVALPPLLGIGAYLAYNLAATGMLLPVSGTAKAAGLWALARNGYATLTTLAPFLDLFGRGNGAWGSEAWRILQMLVPAAAAALHLAGRWVRGRGLPVVDRLRGALREPLVLLSLYVLGKAAYNFTVVPLWNQGHWYYPVSILVFSWIVADAMGRILGRLGTSTGMRRAVTGLCVLVVILQANVFVDQKRQGGLGIANHAFWKRGAEVDAALEARCPGCGLVELDDGILSYSLARPVMNGLGLAIDREASAALRGGELLALAHARGFRLLATLHYAMPAEAYEDREALRAALARNVQLRGQRLDAFEFSVLYTDPASGVHFVEFRPRHTATPR